MSGDRMYTSILYERDDATAIITLNRPHVLNALSTALKRELVDAVRSIRDDPGVRAVIVTGAGSAFCAGQDLNEAKDLDGPGAEEWVREYQRLYEDVRALDVPLIAAINGWAVGAGLQIALLADIRMAAASARLAMPEIRDGIPAIYGLAFLSHVVGMSRAIEMVLTGDALDAARALEAGLVSRVVADDELLDQARKLAAKLGAFAPLALKLDKQWARELTEARFQDAVQFAANAQRAAFEAGDAKRYMEAFLDRKADDTRRH
jgi:enoyl-CoA hydratase